MNWRASRVGIATPTTAAGENLGRTLEMFCRSRVVASHSDESHGDASRILLASLEATGEEVKDDDQTESLRPCE